MGEGPSLCITAGRDNGELVADTDSLGTVARVIPSRPSGGEHSHGYVDIGLPPGRPQRVQEVPPVARIGQQCLAARHPSTLQFGLGLDKADVQVGG